MNVFGNCCANRLNYLRFKIWINLWVVLFYITEKKVFILAIINPEILEIRGSAAEQVHCTVKPVTRRLKKCPCSTVASLGISAAEFRKYCKRLHIDLYMKRKRLHAKL